MAEFDLARAKAKLNTKAAPSAASSARPFNSVNLLEDTKSFPIQAKPYDATKTGIAVNTVKGLPKASFDISRALGKFAVDVVQSTPRGALATVQYVGERAKGTSNEEAIKKTWQPTGITKALAPIYGDKPVSIASEGAEPLKAFGVSENNANKFAAPAVIGMTALDLFTGGGGKKKLIEEAAKDAPDVIKAMEQYIFYNRRNDLSPQVVDTLDKLSIKPTAPVTLYRDGDVVPGKMQSWSKVKPKGDNIVEKTFNPEDILVDTTDPRFTSMFKDISSESLARYNKLENEVIVKGLPFKERGFVTSVKEVVPVASKVAGQYIPRSTDELAIKAANLVKDNPVEAERLAMTGTDEKAVAVASELIKKYSLDAENAVDDLARNNAYDKVAEVANSIAEKLTEQGRAIQAASILGRMTPEGQLRFAAREIQKFNEANPTRRIPELSGEVAKEISDEMKAINAMPDGLDKAMRFQDLQRKIQNLVPTPLWKKVTTVWKAGLLTGIKTTGLNLFSNLSHTATEIAKDAPAAIVDKAASLFTGERTKTFTMRKAFDGVKEGSIKGKRYFSTGFDERNIGTRLDYTRVNFGKGPVAKAFQVYTDTVFKALGTTDQPFYYAALSRSLMDQALAQGKNLGLKGDALVQHAYKVVENPTEQMMRYGTADATTAVFQNKTKLGDAAGTIQKLPGIGQIVLPFAQTPSAVAMQIISYSPVGAMKTLFENVGKGKFDQRMFSQGMGRSIIGTAFLALGYKLGEKGLLSLDYPKGDEAEQELQKADGTKANSIKIGDKWRSPMVLGPIGNVIMMGGHFQRAIEKAGSPTEAAVVAAGGVWKSFMEQTFLTGVNNFADVLQDPARYAGTYLPNLVASGVPTIVSDVARAIDPLERKTQSGFSGESFKERVQARIPGARQSLQPDVDILGRERESVGNPLEILADPTRPSPTTATPVSTELRRLMDAGYRVSPTKLGDRNGYDVLTPEQNTQLWKQTGEILNSKLTNLINSPQYQKADDEQKAKIVDTFVEKSQNYSRAAAVVEATEGLQGAELKAKLTELKEGGLLTRDVYRAFTEIR